MSTQSQISTPPTGKEMGLIKNLYRRNIQNERLLNELEKAYTTALKMINKLGGNVFDYATEMEMMGKGYDYTIVKEYTNKKGQTFLAHFSKYTSKYLKKVAQNSNTPIIMCQTIPITHDKFYFDDTINDFVAIIPK